MSNLVELERQLNEQEKVVALLPKLERLFSNPDFVDVIQKGFCESEVIAYLSNSTEVDRIRPEQREESLEFAKAGVNLKRWFQLQYQKIQIAQNEIANLRQEMEYVRQEGIE